MRKTEIVRHPDIITKRISIIYNYETERFNIRACVSWTFHSTLDTNLYANAIDRQPLRVKYTKHSESLNVVSIQRCKDRMFSPLLAYRYAPARAHG